MNGLTKLEQYGGFDAAPGGRAQEVGEHIISELDRGPSPYGDVLCRLDRAGIDVVKTEGLHHFDGDLGYSLRHGQ